MKGESFIYKGRTVLKDLFRAHVYKGLEKKLVNSWQEFQSATSNDGWLESPPSKEPEKIKKLKVKAANGDING